MSGPFNLNNPNITFAHSHLTATTTRNGFMSSTDKSKLDSIANGATQNSTDADLRDRTTHTGSQPISSITNLQTTLDGKQSTSALLDGIAALGVGTGLLRKTGATTWALDTAAYLTSNQTITITGDVSGSGSTSIALTLANSGVTAGTYRSVTVDAKGRVTAGTNPTTLAGYGITDAQPLDATLSALAGLVTAADRLPYFTGSDVASLATLTSFGRSLIDDVDAATARATLGLGTAATAASTAFQPIDGDLTAIAALAGTSGLLRKTAVDTWTLDSSTYLTANQTITASGDVTGSGTTALTLTLANSGVTAGTYPKVTVDAKGRVTAGSTLVAGDIPSLPGSIIGSGTVSASFLPTGTTAAAGIVQLTNATNSTSTTTAATPSSVKSAYDLAAAAIPATQKGVANGVATLDANGLIPTNQLPSYVDDILEYAAQANFPGTGEAGKLYLALDTSKLFRWTGSVYVSVSDAASSADQATKLATQRSISATGDATWTVNFDGSANATAALTLANSGATAGTYRSVTVDAKGRVTAGTNPTTLSGYGITDAQPLDATLTAVAGATTSANTFIYFTAADTAAVGTVTAFGRSLIDDVDAATARTTLGLGTAATANSTAFQTASTLLDGISAIGAGTGILRKTGASTWALDSNAYLTANQTITVSGDASGSGATNITLTLANSGVTAGTYTSVTVDAKGRVTAGTSPTTLAGYGITDAQSKNTGLTALATKYTNTTNIGAISDRSIPTFNADGTADFIIGNPFGVQLLSADYNTARTLLNVGAAASAVYTGYEYTDDTVLDNLSLSTLKTTMSSAILDLDFIKKSYRVNNGCGLQDTDLPYVLDTCSALVENDPVPHLGVSTFHDSTGLNDTIVSTQLVGISVLPADAAKSTGAIPYVGWLGPRVETVDMELINSPVPLFAPYSSFTNLVRGGLLIERAARNLFNRYTVVDSSVGTTYAYTHVSSGAHGRLTTTVSTNTVDNDLRNPVTLSPAVLVTQNTSNSRHHHTFTLQTAAISGSLYTVSAYVNFDSCNKVYIELANAFVPNTYVMVERSTTVDTSYEQVNIVSHSNTTNRSVRPVKNGWYRVVITAPANSTNPIVVNVGSGPLGAYTNPTLPFVGEGSSRRFAVACVQVETGDIATSYIALTNGGTGNFRGSDAYAISRVGVRPIPSSYGPTPLTEVANLPSHNGVVMVWVDHLLDTSLGTLTHNIVSLMDSNGNVWLDVTITGDEINVTSTENSVSETHLMGSSFIPGEPLGVAIAYSVGTNTVRVTVAHNGMVIELILPNSVRITSDVDNILLGWGSDGAYSANQTHSTMMGHIRRVQVYGYLSLPSIAAVLQGGFII